MIFQIFIFANMANALGNITVTVGMIGFERTSPDTVAFSRSAGVIGVAIQTMRETHLVDQIEFKFLTQILECDYYNQAASIGKTIEYIQQEKVDILIPGPCLKFIIPTGILSTAYRVPILAYGDAFSAELWKVSRFQYLAAIMPSVTSMASAFLGVIKEYGWYNFSLMTSNRDDYCVNMLTAIENQAYEEDIMVSGKIFLDRSNMDRYKASMEDANSRSRVFAYCGNYNVEKREFLLVANEMGYNNSDYVFLMLEMRSVGWGQFEAVGTRRLASGRSPFWLDVLNDNADGMDATADFMVRFAYLFDAQTIVDSTVNREDLQKKVLEAVRLPPINCNSTECLHNQNQSQALYANHLHDVFLNLGNAFNRTIRPDGSWEPEDLMLNMQNTYQGLTGEVVIDEAGNRQSNWILIGLNKSLFSEVRLIITPNGSNPHVEIQYTSEEGEMWVLRGGVRPMNIPRCGFTGRDCPPPAWEQYKAVIIVCIAIATLLVLTFIGSLLAIYHQKISEQKREDAGWQISYFTLTKHMPKSDAMSNRSFASNPSSLSTRGTKTSSTIEDINDFNLFYRDDEPLIAKKVAVNVRNLHEIRSEVLAARKAENDNINKFIGLCLDISPQCSLWKYCARGTVREVIQHSAARIDEFFMTAMITDITNGLEYIHRSPIRLHGRLSSMNCLVDDRWQVKITDYGMSFLQRSEREDKYALLYLAPELLRGQLLFTQECDIYALAIVMSEIVTMKLPYDMDDDKGNFDEKFYFLKKGGSNPPRPELKIPDGYELNMAILHLIRDCWSEDPIHRPPMQTVKSLLKGMQNGQQQNLMDYAMSQMEQYASKLEHEVEDQTRELTEEKKKSDLLLYRMLPRQVAEKLKLGQSVQPESFEQVTIFFSDIVKFTQIAQKCTPLQIINLMNELFTIFDNLIEEHGVYKVETIGDGYLCVSGLPHRNGKQHVKDVADMALGFMDGCRGFRIAHLPREQVQLRIGMNTGPCVAGVVGLTMPRYCLFGDVVNTGSRMESNGKPGMIHMTAASNQLLMELGGYVTASRGDVIIKGKGVMETFWLLGRQGEVNTNHFHSETSVEYNNNILKPGMESLRMPRRDTMEEVSYPKLSADKREMTVDDGKSGMYEQFRTNAFD